MADFQDLAANVSKNYAFYEWKRDAIQFDGLDLAPWLDRVRKAQDDLEFWTICSQYIASFKDSHSVFQLPSDFIATLGFDVDVYEGKVYVDSLFLSQARSKLAIGDELVAIDGKPVSDLIDGIASQIGSGNALSGRRFAASLLVNPEQDLVAGAIQIPASAMLMIHRQDGSTDTVVLRWITNGTPYTQAGPVPSLQSASSPRTRAAAPRDTGSGQGGDPTPTYMMRARKRQHFQVKPRRFLAGFGELAPVFDLPGGFVQRRGTGDFDTTFTGTFSAGGYRIGYLRVADFLGFSRDELQGEMAFLGANTDGMIVDMTRNPGGSGCAVEELASAFAPQGLNSLGVSVRATWEDILGISEDLAFAEEFGATETEIAELRAVLAAYKDAFQKNRGLTTPLPLCSITQNIGPLQDALGNSIAYDKPVLVLVDGLTASAAELFSAILQDNGRAVLYGSTTDGAGGSPNGFSSGIYSESMVNLAQAIAIRNQTIVTMDFPAAPYIENIGVRPDVAADYQTVDNLLNRGKSYVDGFTRQMVDYIASKSSQPGLPVSGPAQGRQELARSPEIR